MEIYYDFLPIYSFMYTIYDIVENIMGKEIYTMKNTTITAHAGCLNSVQDSLDSVVQAIKIGADIAEVDINCLDDGTAVLKHDEVRENDEGLVKVDEVFNLIKDIEIKLNLDIKNKKALKYIEKKAIEIGVVDKLFLSGVDEYDTLVLKDNNYRISYLMNVETEEILDTKELIKRYVGYAIKSSAKGLNINYHYCTEALIKEAHKNNLIVSAWTIDNKVDIERFLLMKVDNITTNRPDLVLKDTKIKF